MTANFFLNFIFKFHVNQIGMIITRMSVRIVAAAVPIKKSPTWIHVPVVLG